ncbi:MAG: GNAT family N-acetyltransferase [Desulfovibrio sp.]|nr:GNAT family N-acetyltransferase [Desulfovibrio sp.]
MELQVLTPAPAAEAPVLRPALAADHAALVNVWRRSVEASHDFLAPGAVEEIEAEVRRALGAVAELWLVEAGGGPAAFLGCTGNHVDMLFVAPEFFRHGLGTRLLDHARGRHGPLTVEVNEANTAAHAFYRARGFVLTGRNPVDSEGRPYPLLLLRQAGA